MIAALLCALLAQTAPAAEPVATVPITEWNNLVLVPVTVQGSSPFQLVLDTAMSAPGILLFSGPRLDALELDFTAGQTVQGAGGQGDPLATRQATASSIGLGGLSLPGIVRRDGAEVRLVIQRGDERLEKRLRLKRLI